MPVHRLVRIRPTAGVDSVHVWRKFLAFEVAGHTYVTAAPAGLVKIKMEKSRGWYKADASGIYPFTLEQADLFSRLTFGGSTFLDVMTQDEAVAVEGGGGQALLDAAQAAETDAQARVAWVTSSGQYEVHPANWPLCIRSRPISSTLDTLGE